MPKNQLKSIQSIREPGSGKLIDIEFIFEGTSENIKEEKFTIDEFKAGSKTRRVLQKIYDLVCDLEDFS